MKLTKNSERNEAKRQMLKDEGYVLAMLWLSLPMLLVVLSWGTPRHLLNRLELMLTDKTPYQAPFLIKTSILMRSLKSIAKNIREQITTRFGRR